MAADPLRELEQLAQRVESLLTAWGELEEHEKRDAIAADIRALATALSQAEPTPPGMVLVPRESLRQMMHYTECYGMNFPSSGAASVIPEYFDMLAAAPAAQVAAESNCTLTDVSAALDSAVEILCEVTGEKKPHITDDYRMDHLCDAANRIFRIAHGLRAAAPAVVVDEAMSLIAVERRRQVEVEGWTQEGDDQHRQGQMAAAAACYASPTRPFKARQSSGRAYEPYTRYEDLWPWADAWWKPTPDDRVRELVKAGALIVAEIERLNRAAALGQGVGK